MNNKVANMNMAVAIVKHEDLQAFKQHDNDPSAQNQIAIWNANAGRGQYFGNVALFETYVNVHGLDLKDSVLRFIALD